jgi:hypothetical protein
LLNAKAGRAYKLLFPLKLCTPSIMAVSVNTPKHTDPATKEKEDKNVTEIKDKPSGKTVKTQKK